MLRLLLDEHISPVVAEQLNARCAGICLALRTWEDGMSTSDEELLVAANKQQITLVTYDLNTIVPLLKFWGEHGITHGGVIFVDNRTIRSDDFGALIQGLERLWKREKGLDWSNRVVFLSRRS